MFRKSRKEKNKKRQKTQIFNIRKNARKLRSLSKIRIPKGLSTEEINELKKYSKWLNDSSKKLLILAEKWNKSGEKESESFNIELLNLQNSMQHENRQFTMVSNIMKNDQDTAKSAINNVR